VIRGADSATTGRPRRYRHEMGWFTLLLTTLGAGAAGAIITTYGTQARDRRAARAEVRACLQRADRIARNRPPHDQIESALADVENAAFIAGMPRHVVRLYGQAFFWSNRTDDRRPELGGENEAIILLAAVAAADLMVRVLWHPWLMLPVQRILARQTRQYLNSGLPKEQQFPLEIWTMDWWRMQRRYIRKVKRARRTDQAEPTSPSAHHHPPPATQ
jgi:hypothetical protein